MKPQGQEILGTHAIVHSDESPNLRRCVRDLLALTALSAYWSRADFRAVAEGLADVTLRSVPAEFVFVRVHGLNDQVAHEVVRTQFGLNIPDQAAIIRRAVDSILQCGDRNNHGLVPNVANPLGDGTVRVAVHPIGFEGDSGYVLVAARKPDFPSQTDTLLLSAAANQAAIVLQHRRAEQVLRASEERFRSLSACSPVGIFTTNTDGQCTYTNPSCQAICGFTFQQALGEGWSNFVHPEDRESVFREWTATAQAGREYAGEFRFRHPNGRVHWTFVRTSPMLSEQGRLLGHVGTVEDITERKQLEDEVRKRLGELAEADRRKDEFLATLAHELRNPLAPIRNALQLIRLASDNKAVLEQARSMMDRQLQQMVRLIDDLLDVSRITRGTIELRKEWLELAEVIQSAVETSRPVVESCGHELTVTFPPEPIYLDADQTRLAQVFSNLLNNSAKYTDRGGHIWLTADRQDSTAVVRVRDNGIGIPPDMLSYIFEMFTRVDRSLEKRHGGLGIGLTLVKRLVEMHGGTVQARSDGPGSGSEFTVCLPVAASLGRPRSPSWHGSRAAQSAKRRLIVADDNEDSANSMAMMLELSGNEVRTAHNGQDALEIGESFQPDAVLLDIGMPKLNGYDAARQIRLRPWGKHVTLIALTGWGQSEDRQRALDAGFDHHLTKPVDPTALEKILIESINQNVQSSAERNQA